MSSWIESNNCKVISVLAEHIGSLTSIIETRMKKKSDTFVAFIGFSKPCDRINRQLLWYKLSKLDSSNQFIHVLKSLYNNVQSTVKIYGMVTTD